MTPRNLSTALFTNLKDATAQLSNTRKESYGDRFNLWWRWIHGEDTNSDWMAMRMYKDRTHKQMC
jgi:hypothetical protein